ncbi:MAG: tetratricopeptide repeat protein [Oscillospiraceae bacterium]|nr:tetratricopeptide repeat protein [Oscillospiraceae bacterium]
MSFQYDFFLSYRHKPLDGEITKKVFNLVESYHLPRALRAQGCEDVRRAFRDTEELPVSRILTDTIDQALRSTRCMILICSVDTPSSEWVDREVATFIRLGRAEHIYPLLISGDRERSFPASLKLVPDIESRIMDIRVPGNPVKKMMAKAETELLRAIADVAGCTEAELLREHKLRKNRRFAFRVAAGVGAFAAVAGISLGLMNLAQSYRDAAQKREAASMRILSELTYSLPDHLTNVPGAYSRIAGILERNTEDINAIMRLSSDRDSAEREVAANYEKLANASTVLGRFDAAFAAQEKAIRSIEELQLRNVEGSEEALASAFNNLGNLYISAGRYEDAAEAYRLAIERQTASGGDERTLAEFYMNAGANATELGNMEEAARSFDSCIALLTNTGEDKGLDIAAQVHLDYGVMLHREGKYADAEEHLRESCRSCEKLLAQVDTRQYRALYVKAMSMLAVILTDAGKFEEADENYSLAIRKAEELAQDQENAEYQRNLAQLCNNFALSLNMRGDYRGADTLYERAAEINRTLAEKTLAASDRSAAALSLLNLGENAFKLGDYSRSRSCFEEGLQIYQATADSLGEYDRAQYLAWQCYYLLIHQRDPLGAFDVGYAAYELQPNNALVMLNLGYACLYCGYDEDADALIGAVASLGEGQVETICRDLEAQQAAGLTSDHIPALLEMLRG